MFMLQCKTMFEAWNQINWCLLEQPLTNFTREVGKGKWVTVREVTLHAEHGFGLNEGEDFQFCRRGRMARLEARYVDPELWTEDLGRMFELRSQLGRINRVQSLSFNFHRRALPNKPVPLGGGCLVGFTLTFNKHEPMFVDVLSRATEITRFYYSDMLFLLGKVREALSHCELTERFPEDEWVVRWSISSAHQNDIAPALFVLSQFNVFSGSPKTWFLQKPYKQTKLGTPQRWADEVRECFWANLMSPGEKTFFTKSAAKRIGAIINKDEWNQAYRDKWGDPGWR